MRAYSSLGLAVLSEAGCSAGSPSEPSGEIIRNPLVIRPKRVGHRVTGSLKIGASARSKPLYLNVAMCLIVPLPLRSCPQSAAVTSCLCVGRLQAPVRRPGVMPLPNYARCPAPFCTAETRVGADHSTASVGSANHTHRKGFGERPSAYIHHAG
jgi:hypothetical protein